MGILYIYYPNGDQVYGCSNCQVPLFNGEDIIKLSLINNLIINLILISVYRYNITQGLIQLRPMTSGLHNVKDLFCIKSQANLGWKYVNAFDNHQKFKGKFMLVTNKVISI